MMTKDDVLQRLLNGEAADTIVKEMTEVVNAALTEKKALDEAKRKEEEERVWQLKDAEVVAEVLNEYLKKYCGGSGSDITGEALVESSSVLTNVLKIADKVEDNVKATVKQTVKEPGKPAKTVVKTGQEAVDWVEDVFNDFLKAFNI